MNPYYNQYSIFEDDITARIGKIQTSSNHLHHKPLKTIRTNNTENYKWRTMKKNMKITERNLRIPLIQHANYYETIGIVVRTIKVKNILPNLGQEQKRGTGVRYQKSKIKYRLIPFTYAIEKRHTIQWNSTFIKKGSPFIFCTLTFTPAIFFTPQGKMRNRFCSRDIQFSTQT